MVVKSVDEQPSEARQPKAASRRVGERPTARVPVDAASRRVGERPTASLCSREATRRDAASTVARYKTHTPLSTYFLHLLSLLSLFAFAFGLRLPAIAALPDAYVETTGTQYFITDVKAGCKLKIVLDFMNRGDNIEADKQQRFFGVDGDSTIVFSLSAYHNGNNNLSYAAQDGQGNWTATGWTLDKTTRRTFTVDPYGNKWDLRNSGASSATHSGAMNTTRTKTGGAYLAIAADNKQTPPNMPGEMRLYSFKAYEYGKLIRCYVPYWDNTKTGLVEFVNGTFLTNCWLSGAAPLLVGGTPTTDYNAYLADSDGARWSTTDARLEWKVAAAASDAAGGTVSADGGAAAASVTGWAPTGGSVTLTAAAASGWIFIGWQGDTSGFTAAELRQTSLTVPVTGPRSLTARFVEISTTNLTAYDYSRDGLIAQWDAVENAGYGYHLSSPGTWAELVSGVTVTHVGSPTYNASNVVFNGNQYFYATVPAVLAALSAKDMTVQLFLRPTEYTSGAGYFHLGSSTANRQLVLDMRQETDTASAYGAFSGLQYASDGWYDVTHVCIPVSTTSYFGKDTLATVRVDADGAKIAFDGGANVHTNTGKGVAPTSPLVNIGWYYGCSKAKFTLYSARFYSHALTEDEVRYNFEMDRARFVYPNRIRRSGTAFAYLCRATVEGGGGGTVSVNDGTAAVSVDGWFAAHSSVTVRATPDEGKVFLCWKGDVSGLTDEQVASAELTFAGDDPRNLTAVFSAPTTALTSRAYVQKGLKAHYDGIENIDLGRHSGTSSIWKDLAGGVGDGTVSANVGWTEKGWTNTADGQPVTLGSAFSSCIAALDFSLEFRVQPSRTGSREALLGNYNGSSGFNAEHNSGSYTDGRVRFYFNGAPDMQPADVVIAKDETATIALANSAAQHLVYKEGTLGASDATAITAATVAKLNASASMIAGGENSRTAMAFRGTYHALRLYSRTLSADELAWNAMLDRHRFDGAALDESKEYGGYRVTSGQVAVKISATSGDASATVRIDDGEAGASASVWKTFDASVTIRATPGAGRAFGYWTGDIEPLTFAQRYSSEITVPCGRPMSLTAVFVTSAPTVGAEAYVQNGLVAHWDGVENAGYGQRGNVATDGWVDLVGGCTLGAQLANDDGCVHTSANGVSLTNAILTAYDVGGPATKVGNAVAAAKKTVEIAVRPDAYRAGQRWFSAHKNQTDDEASRLLLWYEEKGNLFDAFCVYTKAYKNGVTFNATAGSAITCALAFSAANSFTYYGDGVSKGTLAPGGSATSTSSAGITLRGIVSSEKITYFPSATYNAVRVYNRTLTATEVALNANLDRMRFRDADPAALTWPEGLRWQDGRAQVLVQFTWDAEKGGFATNGVAAVADGACSFWADVNSNVTFSVCAKSEYGFTGWTGDVDALTSVQRYASNVTIRVTRPLSFAPTYHEVTTCYWRGTNTLASVAGNWRDADGNECVPMTGDAIVLDQPAKDLQWNLNNVSVASWTQDGFDGKVTFLTGSVNYGNNRGCLSPDGAYRELSVTGNVELASGWWTHAKNNFTYSKTAPEFLRSEGYCRLVARIGGDLNIAVNGAINVSSNSFASWQGPDGENGGAGGLGSSYWGPGGDKKAFGLIKKPRMIGSNHYGGGNAELHVGGTVTVDGQIQANGIPETSGMGAGGSVWITAKALRGASTGSIMANAGKSSGGGGGAGGRISVQLSGEGEDFSQYLGKMEARSYSSSYGGTVYHETAADNGKGELRIVGWSDWPYHAYDETVRGGGTPMATTDLEDSTFRNVYLANNVRAVVMSGTTCRTDRVTTHGTWNYQWIVLKGGTLQVNDDWTPTNCHLRTFYANSTLRLGENGDRTLYVTNDSNCLVYWDKNMTVEGSVCVKSSGRIRATPNGNGDSGWRLNPHITGTFTVETNGLVTVGGIGYNATYGPGAPSDADHINRGGTHGGRAWDNAGIATYGSIRNPVKLGSGGRGQAGGGAIHITADGAMRVDGTISANGTGGANAGAGGSIWLEGASLMGTGVICANGGSGNNAVNSGGGGRIAVTLTDPLADFTPYTGSFSARAGLYNSKSSGACGTIYLRTGQEGEKEGLLLIDSGAYAAANLNPTEISTSVTETEVGRVVITNNAALQMLKSCTLTVQGDFADASENTLPLGEVSDGTLAGGTVAFTNDAVVSHVTGTNRFADVTVATPGKRMEFGTAGSLAAVVAGGNFNIQGTNGNWVLLRSVTDSTAWPFMLENGASTAISYANVLDSDASAGLKVSVDDTNVDMGRNVNWVFSKITPGMTITWTGAKSDVWSDPDNWDLGRVPVDTDAVVIGDTSSVPALTAPLVLNRLTVGAGATLQLAGFDLTVTNALAVSGTLDASTGASVVTVGGDVTFATANSFSSGASTFVLAGGEKQTVNFAGAAMWNVVAANDADFSEAFSANALTCSSDATRTLRFRSGTSYTFGNLTLATTGEAAEPLLTVRSMMPGTPWRVTVTAKADIRNTALGDTSAIGCTLYPELPSTDLGGNNANVIFGTTSSRWRAGTASGKNWNDAANWEGGIPTEVTRVVFDTGATVTLGTGGVARAIEIDAGKGTNVTFVGESPINIANTLELMSGKLTQQGGGLIAVKGNAYLRSGTTLRHPRNTYENASTISPDVGYRVYLSVGGDMVIEDGASINVWGCGWAGNWAYTAGPGCQNGASHGARKDAGAKAAYGSMYHPTHLGSGASYDIDGGGRVRLSVTGTLTVDGTIDAGAETSSQSPGAGGSIWIDCGTLLGAGQIDAEGGWFNDYYNPGCGGRIAIYQHVASSFGAFTGKILANGGAWNRTGNLPESPAGTIYLQTAAEGDYCGTVVIDNLGGGSDGYVDLPVTSNCPDPVKCYRYTTFDLRAGGRLGLRADVEIAELEMVSSSKLFLNGHKLKIRSRKHRNKSKRDALGNCKGDWPGTVDYTGAGSTILWPHPGAAIIVR